MTDSATPDSKTEKNLGKTKATQTPQVQASGADKPADIVAPSSVETKQSRGGALSVFAILLSLIALGGSAFTWYQDQVVRVKQESMLSVGVSEIGGQVSRLGDSIARLRSDQANVVNEAQLSTASLQLETKLAQQIKEVVDQQAALKEVVSKINSDQQQGVNQYTVDESSQLLRLANNSVVFSGDVNSAISALSLADAQLKSLLDPRYSAVRSQILKEINTLKNVELPDLEALAVRLQGVADLVPSLPLENEPVPQVSVAKPVVNDQALTWRTEFKKIWQDMLSSVQIQRVDQPPKPLLAPEQRYFLDQNLILNLEKAELAIIQGRSASYKLKIEKAITWLNDYFDLDNPQVQATVQELNELAGLSFTSDLPDISGSYQLLQSIKGGQ